MAFQKAQQVAPLQQEPSLNPFDTNGGDSVTVPALQEEAVTKEPRHRLFVASIDNSLDLLRPVSPTQMEEGVASEDGSHPPPTRGPDSGGPCSARGGVAGQYFGAFPDLYW